MEKTTETFLRVTLYIEDEGLNGNVLTQSCKKRQSENYALKRVDEFEVVQKVEKSENEKIVKVCFKREMKNCSLF